jgi:hypothetical protein
MANITIPRADFSPLSSLFKNFATARKLREDGDMLDARKSALASLPKNPDGSPDLAAGAMLLLQNGDHRGAMSLASMARVMSRQSMGGTSRQPPTQTTLYDDELSGFDPSGGIDIGGGDGGFDLPAAGPGSALAPASIQNGPRRRLR